MSPKAEFARNGKAMRLSEIVGESTISVVAMIGEQRRLTSIFPPNADRQLPAPKKPNQALRIRSAKAREMRRFAGMTERNGLCDRRFNILGEGFLVKSAAKEIGPEKL